MFPTPPVKKDSSRPSETKQCQDTYRKTQETPWPDVTSDTPIHSIVNEVMSEQNAYRKSRHPGLPILMDNILIKYTLQLSLQMLRNETPGRSETWTQFQKRHASDPFPTLPISLEVTTQFLFSQNPRRMCSVFHKQVEIDRHYVKQGSENTSLDSIRHNRIIESIVRYCIDMQWHYRLPTAPTEVRMDTVFNYATGQTKKFKTLVMVDKLTRQDQKLFHEFKARTE